VGSPPARAPRGGHRALVLPAARPDPRGGGRARQPRRADLPRPRRRRSGDPARPRPPGPRSTARGGLPGHVARVPHAAHGVRRGAPGHRGVAVRRPRRPGRPAMRAGTVGELKAQGYRPKSVKQEMRDNLIARLRGAEPLFAGIVGYDESVVPQIENAVLSGQDIVFLGERGQAKTRMARLLVGLLDDAVPALAGCEINDDPFAPICGACRARLDNALEQGDCPIRGYKVRLPLDVYVAASANPEDYTNRGRIITPLKDRFGSQIRTHYPRRLDDEIAIMEAERTGFPADGFQTCTPGYMKLLVAELTHLARRSPEISQRSGVSVRVTICNWENLLSSALRRAIRLGEREVAPRVSDLPAIAASTTGKIELETLGDQSEDKVLGKLVQRAVLNVFNKNFAAGELEIGRASGRE